MASDKRKVKTKKKYVSNNLKPYIIAIASIGIMLTIYIGYRASVSERHLFSISLIALFIGLFYESLIITNNWKHVVYKFIGSYFFSLICFLPYKREYNYNIENHIENWPYYFIIIFALATAIFYKKEVTQKLTEGITLLLSISIIYWVIDYGFINIDNWLLKFIFILSLVFSAFSIINGLTYLPLSRTSRLTLSIWSTIVVFAFAIDNIIRVFQNQDIEKSKYLAQGLYIGLQYFLLGISAVYIIQNYLLLAGFLPSKNGKYKQDLAENINDHIERYSDQQVPIGHSIYCIFYALIAYGLNHYYQILPRHTMIWFVFLTFPLTLRLIDIFKTEKTTANNTTYK